MGVVQLMLKNARRSPARAAMTVVAVAISLVAFVLLRTLTGEWKDRVAQTPNDRVVSRHKIGWAQTLPWHYADVVRGMPGIKTAVAGRFTAAMYPQHERVFFDFAGMEPEPFVAMHYEVSAPEEHKRAFITNRQGALVSAELAREFGWKLGDRVTLVGRDSPRQWLIDVACIFQSTRAGFAQRTIWIHYDYFNETMPADERDGINLIAAQLLDPNEGARIAKAIDIYFDDKDSQTFTQEDKALNASFTGRFGAMLSAMDLVSWLVLGVVALILGNTVVMGVRERTQEFGVMRAIGFRPPHLLGLVLGEAALLGAAGGALGLGLSFPLIEGPVSRFMEERMQFDPLLGPYHVALGALVAGTLVALIAGALPAYQVSKLRVVEALRHIG